MTAAASSQRAVSVGWVGGLARILRSRQVEQPLEGLPQ